MDRRIHEYRGRLPPEDVSPFVDVLGRFIIALTGGAALVVPIVIMSLPSMERDKTLIIASFAMLVFAVLLSVGMRASNKETLAATATYAAVMVALVR